MLLDTSETLWYGLEHKIFISRCIWMWRPHFHEILEILNTSNPQKSSLWVENLRKIDLK